MKSRYDLSKPSTFLEGARPFRGENKFIVGTFERGVTVYRQQIRALNLVYSLVEAHDLRGRPVVPQGSRVTVIGGGAFGTTVAAAAAYAKFRVVLLEQRQTLLHLQRGCDTRWLHPRFYDWPAPESESHMARLLFLDWCASDAGNVALQIERQIMDLQKDELAGLLEIDVGVSELRVGRTRNGTYEVSYRSDDGQNIRPCEIIVYAVGFGIEANHGDNDSYWRNDGFGQSDLSFKGKPVRYVVSGFGDGALVDVFRLSIRDFRYERIFREMFSGRGKPFFNALNQIRKSPGDKAGSLFDRLALLEAGKYKEAISKAKNQLKQRLRSDTKIILNSKAANFRQGLSLTGVSFSNALLAYFLFRLKAVRYKRGSIRFSGKRYRLENERGARTYPEWLRNPRAVIIRHGTDRESALRNVGCGGAIRFLTSRSTFDSGEQIFPAGWWGQHVYPDATSAIRKSPAPVEYVPPPLRTHATTFVSTLASILRGQMDSRHRKEALSKRKFRVTLHRLTQFDGEDVFQQVTPYKGRVKSEAGVGRFFPVAGGIVGLACRTGSLVVARRTDPAKFNEIWRLTELDQSGAKEIKPYVDSLLCCPFFASDSAKGRHRVILALFVDSADPSFFDSLTLRTISTACRGFVDLLESLHRERMLWALPASKIGYKVPPASQLKALRRQLMRLGVTFVDASNAEWKEGLTFKELRSLDFQVGYQDSLV